MGFERKLRREQLKKQLGTNKINEFYHAKYDSLEKRMRDGIKRAKES